MKLSASGVDVVVRGERLFLFRQAKCDAFDLKLKNQRLDFFKT